jgi:phenylacetate-CoA ligase
MSSALEQLYAKSPAFVQNIGVSFYGLKIYRREYGRKFERLLAEFDQRQWFTREQLVEYQAERLRALINHCYEHVPYYRRRMDERKLKPLDIKAVVDIAKLPSLTRDEIRTHFDELVADNVDRSKLILGHTSGTTGSPLEFYYDSYTCLVKNAADWRQKRLAGINPGDRMAFFLGRVVVPIAQSKPPFWRKNWLLNHTFFSSFHMSPQNLATYIEQLKSLNPSAVEGYPSTMFIIASYLNSIHQTLPVKAAFTSSETLFPHQREAIEKAFDCRLFDFYGMAERVVFATECEAHQGRHINDDFGITEIMASDGQPAQAGEMGRIYATGLHNYAMPLVRYVTSDITALKATQCSCGRSFPLMEDITTKAEDIITTLDGRYISSSILTHPFKPMHMIEESQIIQEDPGHVRIKIVRRPDYQDKDSQHLLNELGKRLGEGMKIEIEFVDSIERTKNGKFRWVISKVPLKF